MQGGFIQKVILTLILALFASVLIWFYKTVIQKSDKEINEDWRATPPAATAHP